MSSRSKFIRAVLADAPAGLQNYNASTLAKLVNGLSPDKLYPDRFRWNGWELDLSWPDGTLGSLSFHRMASEVN